MSIKIIGTGAALPQKTIDNQELAGFLDTSDEWITSRTGIKSRHVCTTETITDLAEQAAREALLNAHMDIREVDMILCSTLGGEYVSPSLACTVAERFNVSLPAFDINAACSGFLYALDAADTYIAAKKAKNVLIVSAEMMTRYADWTDRSTCVLFGDGAGAAVATEGESLKYIRVSSAGNVKVLSIPASTGNSPFTPHKPQGYLKMDGQEVFKFAVSTVNAETERALGELNMTSDDIDYYILHQANKRIIASAQTRQKQPESKFPVNIDQCGNMSAASIPVLLHQLLEQGKIRPGMKLLLNAFGAGMTWATAILVWE